MTELLLNSKIYPEAAVKKSVRAYARLAAISYRKKGAYYRVGFENCKPGFAKIIKDEFSNYVLGVARGCL